MSLRQSKSITLLELIISISILGLLVLAFSNLDTFTRHQVMSSDRRAKLQNDAFYILEHMTKEINNAIGSFSEPPIYIEPLGSDTLLEAHIDSDHDGLIEASDKWIAYRFYAPTGTDKYQIRYCPDCSNKPCADCTPSWNDTEILSKKITLFFPTFAIHTNPDYIDDYVDVQVSACWDPEEASFVCGKPDNPSITLQNRISMPAVSSR